jgi:sulfatase maturation enzyme AslB (radical SAM superfamily)
MELSNLITCLDFEISSICNAGCVVCPRGTIGFYNQFTQTYWRIDEVEKHIDLEIIQNLKTLVLCGNFGDPMGNPDIVKIVRYFKENNRSIDITISTNGSIGNSADYAELAELGVTLRVALDGVGEFNELYRVNAKWDKIVQNLNSFALKSSKHQLEIQFLMWAETTNQIIPMIDFIKSIGFGRLWLRRPYTTGEKTEVFDIHGASTHFLTEIKHTELKKYLQTYWEFYQLDELKLELSKIDSIESTLEMSNFLIKRTPIQWPKNDYKKNDVTFNQTDINKFNSTTNQTCFSKNKRNPSNLSDNDFNVFITHDKLLMPCCMIPPEISISIHYHTGNESPMQKEVLNKMLEIGFEKFSLKNTTLKNVFNSGVLHEFVYNDLVNKTPLKMCQTICGKCEPILNTKLI